MLSQIFSKDDYQVVFSDKAYNDLVFEVFDNKTTETGGIFLGNIDQDKKIWYIIEMIDPGYNEIIRQHAYFEYDHEYVNHLANIISKRYKKDLQLVGLWHRHPGSMDTFSITDDGTNLEFLKICKHNPISALVNLDPDFRLTLYHVDDSIVGRPNYTKIDDVKNGTDYIPKDYHETLNYEDIINNHKQSMNFQKDKNQLEEKLDEIVTNEFDYLEKQTTYEYDFGQYNYDDRSVGLTLKSSSKKICFRFFIDEELTIFYDLEKFEDVNKVVSVSRHKYKPITVKKVLEEDKLGVV